MGFTQGDTKIKTATTPAWSRPERQRECAHGGKPEFAFGGGCSKCLAVMHQMRARFIHGRARRRRHLNLRLQHFGHDAIAELLLGEAEKFRVGPAYGATRLGVEHEIFFFHADGIHARDNSFGPAAVPPDNNARRG